MSLLLAFLVGAGYMLIPPAVAQGKELIGQLPGFIRGIRRSTLFHRLDGYLNLSERLQDLEGGSGDVIRGAAKPVMSAVGGILSSIVAVVTILTLAVFMVIFGGPLRAVSTTTACSVTSGRTWSSCSSSRLEGPRGGAQIPGRRALLNDEGDERDEHAQDLRSGGG